MSTCMITKKVVKNMIERRDREIHKGDCGRVLMVSGSEGMMGAAILSCKGAIRSGAGLVQLSIPTRLFPIAQVAIPEATCIDHVFSKLDLSRYDAVAVGPGLGRSEESVNRVKNILDLYEGSLVLDADGLNMIAQYDLYDVLRARRGETIITPHMGEAKRLIEGAGERTIYDYKTGDIDERTRIAYKLKDITDATVVLKGAGTIVATLEGKTYINITGNPGMATGGSGDVLTGIIAGLWGQKWRGQRRTAQNAAACGVFIHGLAGDLAAETFGEYGLIAGDIAETIPFAIKEISE